MLAFMDEQRDTALCLWCSGAVRPGALRCRHCGADLSRAGTIEPTVEIDGSSMVFGFGDDDESDD